MDVLWEDPGRDLTGRDVADALPDYAYTTVATVLDRLGQKGLVSRRMDRRTIRFSATGTREEHTAELMHETLVVTGDPDSALVRFAKTLSSSEADVLRRAGSTEGQTAKAGAINLSKHNVGCCARSCR